MSLRRYGVKVKAWRAGAEAVLQRVSAEARGGRHEVDIVQNNAPENEAAHRQRLLQEVRSPYLSELIPQAVPAHREWVGITLDVRTTAYNTDKVKQEELPGPYQDLLDPRWKDRLGIEAFNHGWFATLLSAMGEKEGLKLFSDIVATNGISVRKGHSLLTSLVASGGADRGPRSATSQRSIQQDPAQICRSGASAGYAGQMGQDLRGCHHQENEVVGRRRSHHVKAPCPVPSRALFIQVARAK